jgi:hypothetical protein
VRLLLLIIAVLLVMLLVGADIAEPDDAAVQVKTVQQWGTERPPYVVDAQMFTTTTTTTSVVARARTAPIKPKTTMRAASAAPAIVDGSINGYPCGADLPPCYVLRRESMMAADPPRVWNGNCYMPVGSYGQCGRSSASGLWQVLRSTWNHYAGFVNAADAPVDVQNDFARMLWAGGHGCGHWSAC